MAVALRTDTDTANQLRELEADLLSGVPVRRAVRTHRERHNLSPKRARRDLALLRLEWSRDQNADFERGLAVARAERIYRRAIEAGNDTLALEAEKLRAGLLGLLDASKTNTNPSKGPSC